LVPPYYYPDPFPAEGKMPEKSIVMNDGNIIAVPDRLRPAHYLHRYDTVTNPAENYPLVAPADRLKGGPFPVAAEDKVPAWTARYLDASFHRDMQLRDHLFIDQLFHLVDSNKDGAISAEEFKNEVETRQNKSADDAIRLWTTYHLNEAQTDMNEVEFKRLARTGFDIIPLGRDNISDVLSPSNTADIGFWGGGATCPNGNYAQGVALKIDGNANGGINAIKMRCTDGTELATIEGPFGEWTAWQECPAGQVIYGYRVKKSPLDVTGSSNNQLKNLAFECRSATMTSFKKLPPVGGEMGGGWTKDIQCSSSSAFCGAQARMELVDDPGSKGAGVTNVRFYCCTKEIDCAMACAGTSTDANSPAFAECLVCRQAKFNAQKLR